MHSRTLFPIKAAGLFPVAFSARFTAAALAAALTLSISAQTPANAPQQPATAQDTTQAAGQTITGSTSPTTPTATDAQAGKTESATLSFNGRKKKKAKEEKVVASKDTKKADKSDLRMKTLETQDANLPDKALYDKAQQQVKKGHFDVARLDLETLLNTYPDSQFQMRAKLAIADSWYKESGEAALTQAEQEYTDFITFFPNVPEAAEAQMRVGDIYFKQMDVPDRDYQKAVKAEAAYRQMLKVYPDSPLAPEARQKLRDVQEVLAIREAEIGAYYATHANWAATIARYQTVVDLYPQYSHMDDILIGIGDAYESEANFFRVQTRMPEGPRSQLVRDYDSRAAAEYRKVVLDHAAAAHVEDAKERLQSMGLPIPTPTPEEVAASEALEGSRAQYNLQKRLTVLFLRRPDTVTAARLGDPPLDDAPVTVAPAVGQSMMAEYKAAFSPDTTRSAPTLAAPAAPAPDGTSPAAESPAVPAAPPTLTDVPAAGADTADTTTMTPASDTSQAPVGDSVGVQVLTPGVRSSSAPLDTAPAASTATHAAATGAQDTNYGLTSAGPKDATPLPAAEAPAAAPDQVNEAAGKATPDRQVAAPGDKKTVKPSYDKDDESSSKHKKKKGVAKINPF
jgi:outer membrane protein assembly factor BamD